MLLLAVTVLGLGAGPSRASIDPYGFSPRPAPSAERTAPGPSRVERVDRVLRAARSAIGTPYRYGGASRRSGFDCSGLTSWAWRRGGHTLPHNSAEQYRVTRHVRRKNLRPGDLLFFYQPIHHVAIYAGKGWMIEAAHTGTRVRRERVYWQYFTAAGRPA